MWKKILVLPKREGQIYILPTGHGAAILGTVVIMLAVGSTFNNNLVNTLAFLLFSILTVSMVQTYVNLKGLRIKVQSCEDAFAGGQVRLSVGCTNYSGGFRHNLWIEVSQLSVRVRLDGIANEQTQFVNLFWLGNVRGQYEVAPVTLFTRYPLGLFRAWTTVLPRQKYFVYPRPMGGKPLPTNLREGGSLQEDRGSRGARGGDEFNEHRLYRTGDSPRRIDWRASARYDQLLLRTYRGQSSGWIEISLDEIKGHDLEQRLSQMSAWISLAETKNLSLRIRLPGLAAMNAVDYRSRRAVLQSLATYSEAA